MSFRDRFAPPQPAPPPSLATRRGRLFRDSEGEWWCAYERSAGVQNAEPERSLVFESMAAFRRVRRFPGNWMTLSDAELEAMSWTS